MDSVQRVFDHKGPVGGGLPFTFFCPSLLSSGFLGGFDYAFLGDHSLLHSLKAAVVLTTVSSFQLCPHYWIHHHCRWTVCVEEQEPALVLSGLILPALNHVKWSMACRYHTPSSSSSKSMATVSLEVKAMCKATGGFWHLWHLFHWTSMNFR